MSRKAVLGYAGRLWQPRRCCWQPWVLLGVVLEELSASRGGFVVCENSGFVVWAQGPWHHLEHLVAKGAGHDLEFWNPGLSVWFWGTHFTPDPPEVLLYTLDGHFQLRTGK